ncbi:hypothetical protein PFICI_04484 [Pestalotiopsis fici W106-1]|uniref:Uncharacterized protein n=1 Tax=Pestalotiopsis fici (strain W106-1 / CGMCC3.15140) TaxID=1229662 RepID=W3X908_PESFW|nr:uncharacterized protein PFICI_04484 [Pestalotiopsis fici W106-1]ETS82608.1 hypothetical protein PFICI_04484 [Pestalotiopsis fici W106-1]
MPTSTQDHLASPSTPKPAAGCDWDGDKAEPELDDLAYQHAPREPIPTPQVPRTPSPEALPSPLVDQPAIPSVKGSPPQEPAIHEPAPVVDSRLEWHQKHHAEKEKAHDERHRARAQGDTARRELKKKEKSERKARERARRESRKRERQERKSRKSETKEPRKPSVGARLKEKVESELQVLADELTHGIRKILPSSDTPKLPKSQDQQHEGPMPLDPLAHQDDTFTRDKEIVQAAKNADDIAMSLGHDGASDRRPASRILESAPKHSNKKKPQNAADGQDKSAQHDIHSSPVADKYECGHTKDVADGDSSTAHNKGEIIDVQHKSQPVAPGMLKRANCLCGALPPTPSEYAADEPVAVLTPRIDTPGHEDPFPTDPWDKK